MGLQQETGHFSAKEPRIKAFQRQWAISNDFCRYRPKWLYVKWLTSTYIYDLQSFYSKPKAVNINSVSRVKYEQERWGNYILNQLDRRGMYREWSQQRSSSASAQTDTVSIKPYILLCIIKRGQINIHIHKLSFFKGSILVIPHVQYTPCLYWASWLGLGAIFSGASLSSRRGCHADLLSIYNFILYT